MQKKLRAETKIGLLLTLLALGVATVLLVIPSQFRSSASDARSGGGLFVRTQSHVEEIPNYDIRTEKGDGPSSFLQSARESAAKDASAVAELRAGFVRGEDSLRSRIPHAKVEYNSDIRTPEVITPDVWKQKIEFLSGPSALKHSEILRSFVRENNQLIGVTDQQVDSLKVIADYTNPNGYLSFAHLEQRINDIPVFRGEVKAGFNKDGQIIRVINNLAPGLDYGSLSTDFRNPADSVRAAHGYINAKATELQPNEAASNELKVVFGSGDWATTAEKMYFPTEPGVAVPSWRVTIWQPVSAYMVIVDAASGTLLWRKNLTEDQTQSATYQVYRNVNAFIGAHDNPAPLSPGPVDPTTNQQGALATRSNHTLIGNEAPYNFNNNGWITDGANITDGNALEAGIDRDGTTGVDAPQTGNPNRVFDSTWNPPPGNPAPGDDPLTAQAQRGAVIQMFYVMNRYHDEMYRLGFTEQAFNFQADNFGRGGAGADRVSAEGQDSSGTNNANFSTPADGGRGRMQMYLWSGPTPDYDGTADAEVIIHEVTHGTSNRLHGNATGLSTNMSRGMGEGWSDFYGEAMLATAADPINAVFTTGGYATYLLGGMQSNYYYGIRRFPRAPITFTGGPARPGCNNQPCPHNPFTFKHLNGNCDTTLGTTAAAVSSAFPRNPVISTSSGTQACDQVHNAGEVWSSALWEVRNRMVTRLGFIPGTTRVLQVVTDGMKLAPTGPTFLQERDAIIAAAAALPIAPEASADVADVREGFRVRGMGFSASIQNAGTGANNAAVTEAFDVPNVVFGNPITVSDSTGDNDGFPEPGETLTVSVPVTNNSGNGTINNVMVSITGGGTVNYGSIADGATVVQNISYTVPGGAACGSLHSITITGTSSLGAMSPRMTSFQLGVPVGGAPVTFTSSTPVRIPGTGTGPGVADVYPSNLNVSGLSGSKKIKLEFTTLNTTYPGDMDWLLVGPGGQKFIVMSDAISSFTTQTNATVILKDDAAAGLPATGSTNMAGEWKPTDHASGDTFDAPAPAGPYQSPAPVGAATFASVFGSDGAAMNGTWSLYGRDDVSGDFATIAGWKLTFEANDFACSVAAAGEAPYDFDGDNKTDVAIFRPSVAQWWVSRSSNASVFAAQFGATTDRITPGDFTGDNKADMAFFRPSTGEWYVLRSEDFSFYSFPFGTNGDTPVPADYDNDNKTDAAVFRPSNSTWYISRSSGGTTIETFGTGGDLPVPADYDGDGNADIAIYRPSAGQWWLKRSTAGVIAISFGGTTDKPIQGRYTADNKADVAFWRASTGEWFVLRSEDFSFYSFPFGQNGDTVAPGDYDGDGKFDAGIFRPSNNTWFVQKTTGGTLIQTFGTAGDRPVPNAYVP